MGISQKPYPPIVDTWNPAVIKGENIKIYFTLSAYNSINDIRPDTVLVDIVNISNNESIVNTFLNHGFQLVESLHSVGNGNYYIEIPKNMVLVTAGQSYKIQLRFVSKDCVTSKETFLTTDYYEYSDYISDFSEVTLLKIISRPVLELNSFPTINSTATYIISTPSLLINGKLIFADEDDNECLTSYNIRIYENSNSKATIEDSLFLDSGEIFPDTKELNLINYLVKKNLMNKYYYLLEFTYTTKSGYSNTEYFEFTTIYEADTSTFPPVIETKLDSEDGSIIVKISDYNLYSSGSGSPYSGYMVLRRSSSIDNFSSWEEMKYFKYNDEVIDEKIKDYTVQAGVIYRYQVIPINWAGYRGVWADILGMSSSSSEVDQ